MMHNKLGIKVGHMSTAKSSDKKHIAVILRRGEGEGAWTQQCVEAE